MVRGERELCPGSASDHGSFVAVQHDQADPGARLTVLQLRTCPILSPLHHVPSAALPLPHLSPSYSSMLIASQSTKTWTPTRVEKEERSPAGNSTSPHTRSTDQGVGHPRSSSTVCRVPAECVAHVSCRRRTTSPEVSSVLGSPREHTTAQTRPPRRSAKRLPTRCVRVPHTSNNRISPSGHLVVEEIQIRTRCATTSHQSQNSIYDSASHPSQQDDSTQH